MACSSTLRTPTPRKSTDLQCGQRIENIVTVASFLAVSLCRAAGSLDVIPERGRRVTYVVIGAAATTGCAARVARSLDLLRGPKVGL
jgi:hypothetical protein